MKSYIGVFKLKAIALAKNSGKKSMRGVWNKPKKTHSGQLDLASIAMPLPCHAVWLSPPLRTSLAWPSPAMSEVGALFIA